MKLKKTIKGMFIVYLCILMIGLYVSSFIGYKDNPPAFLGASIINTDRPLDTFDYKVLDKNDYEGECVYKTFYTRNEISYETCGNVEDIYIVWSNGRIKSLMDSLIDYEVNIDDLINNKKLNAKKVDYEK